MIATGRPGRERWNSAFPAHAPWHQVADQLRPRAHKLADLMVGAEMDVLAYMGFPQAHRAKLRLTNPIERLNGEIKRRAEVVGIFPNEAAITRLIGAILLEKNDEWAVQRSRCYTNPRDTIIAAPASFAGGSILRIDL